MPTSFLLLMCTLYALHYSRVRLFMRKQVFLRSATIPRIANKTMRAVPGMVVRAKWVLAFRIASIVSLLLVLHWSPGGFRTAGDKIGPAQLRFFRQQSPEFNNILDSVQQFLGYESSRDEYHTDDQVASFGLNGGILVEELEQADPIPVAVPKIAYIFAGSARSFACPKVHWSIRSHLIDGLGGDPHVFVRLSLEDNVNVKTGAGVLKTNLDYGQDDVQEILKILNPKKVDYFTFSNQIEEMQRLYPGDSHTVFRENDLRRYSMFFHRCMAYKMALAYELEHKIRFDWVVLVRVDAAWLEPVLPIGAYKNDRVWITETGYDVFNDQFMLIPRQFSDYLYDLDTKVQKGVYCLGGPDVETWKCNPDQLAAHGYSPAKANLTLEHCCPDIRQGKDNLMGMSEAIHKRHLQYGKLPISIGRFPVFLTRWYARNGRMECHPECFRIYALHYNEYLYRAGGMPQVYPYLASTEWPDRRSVGISARDRTLCYYLTRQDAYPWKPLSAASPEVLQHHRPSLSLSLGPAAQEHDQLAVLGTAGLGIEAGVDYSKPLHTQAARLHPSVLQNPKDTEAWRIRPSWNVEGCLTFSFETKDLHWERCVDHSRMKRTRFDSRQMFFLYVVPARNKKVVENRSYHTPVTFPESTYSGEVSNITRVLVVDSEPRVWDFNGKLYCLTVEDAVQHAAVGMAECTIQGRNPKQEFTTVRAVMDGSTPQTMLGQLQLAAVPELCVARSDNALPNKAQLKFERERVPKDDKFVLKKCDLVTMYHIVTFEFELVSS